MTNFAGLKIQFSLYALKETDVRLFPESKHRSKRIRKKLIKRFGGEFKKVPCIFQTPFGIIAHPSFKAELINGIREEKERNYSL